LKTLDTLGLGVQYAKLAFVVQVYAVHHHLQLTVELKHWVDVRNFEISVSGAMIEVENAVRILHLHKRVIEEILSMILLISLGEKEKTKAARLRHGEKMSRLLNEHVFGTHEDPGTYCPIHLCTGK
jgi:predicted amino acid-binding ACT domain protein